MTFDHPATYMRGLDRLAHSASGTYELSLPFYCSTPRPPAWPPPERPTWQQLSWLGLVRLAAAMAAGAKEGCDCEGCMFGLEDRGENLGRHRKKKRGNNNSDMLLLTAPYRVLTTGEGVCGVQVPACQVGCEPNGVLALKSKSFPFPCSQFSGPRELG